MRYERAPKLWWDDDKPFVPNLTVYEPETAPIETGLLDAQGNKIMRRSERPQIGFDLTGKDR